MFAPRMRSSKRARWAFEWLGFLLNGVVGSHYHHVAPNGITGISTSWCTKCFGRVADGDMGRGYSVQWLEAC